VKWQSKPTEFDLAVVNLANHQSQCRAPLRISPPPKRHWWIKNLLSADAQTFCGDDLFSEGLLLDLPPHGVRLLLFIRNREPVD